MDVYEALYTTRMMRRMRTDPVPLDVQKRILDAAVRAPNGANAQRWHFLLVDDPDLKSELGVVFRESRRQEHADLAAGRLGKHFLDPVKHAETMRKIKIAGDYFADHFDDIPLLLFAFYAIDDHNGANIYPAVWSAMLAARAEGVGSVLTTMLRYQEPAVAELLGVPAGEGWKMNAMVALGYPLGPWRVAEDRVPAHEVSSRNKWGQPLGAVIPEPLWTPSQPSGGAETLAG